jgi:hypothetical protein
MVRGIKGRSFCLSGKTFRAEDKVFRSPLQISRKSGRGQLEILFISYTLLTKRTFFRVDAG